MLYVWFNGGQCCQNDQKIIPAQKGGTRNNGFRIRVATPVTLHKAATPYNWAVKRRHSVFFATIKCYFT